MGPAGVVQANRFNVGDEVVSPRVAVPFDLRRPDGTSTPAYRITVPAAAGSVLTVPGNGGLVPPAAPTAPASASADVPKASASRTRRP